MWAYLQKTLSRIRDLFILLAITFLLAELGIRILGHTDSDGQFTFLGFPLKPYAYPLAATEARVQAHLASGDSLYTYHPELGWTLRPNAETHDDLYVANSAGMRSPDEYAIEPAVDVLRIAAFGDSFTFGSQVGYEDTWAYQLEQLLAAQGIRTEILNFGVAGYGMAQVAGRWQHLPTRHCHIWLLSGRYVAQCKYLPCIPVSLPSVFS